MLDEEYAGPADDRAGGAAVAVRWRARMWEAGRSPRRIRPEHTIGEQEDGAGRRRGAGFAEGRPRHYTREVGRQC